ncbi:unnamed protein product, partial [Ectocarpus sp. 12 AP-2014]
FELTIKFVGTVGVSILRLRRQGSEAFSLLSPRRGGDGLGGSGQEVVMMVGNASAALGNVAAASPGRGMTGDSSAGKRVVYGSLELENVTKALPL